MDSHSKWIQLPCDKSKPIPPQRSRHAACFGNRAVYVYGGRGNSRVYNDLWRYTLHHGRWDQLNCTGDKPRLLQEHTLTFYNDSLYLFGGQFAPGTETETPLWILNLLTLVWRKHRKKSKERIPFSRRGHSAVTLQNHIIIYGGYVDMRGSSSELWLFDMDSVAWHLACKSTSNNSGPGRRHGHSAVVYKNTMWIVGGMRNLTALSTMWKWDLKSQRWHKVRCWNSVPSIHSHSACVLQDDMILVGGMAHGTQQDTVWKLNFKRLVWQRYQFSGPGPLPFIHHVCVAVPTVLLRSMADGSLSHFNLGFEMAGLSNDWDSGSSENELLATATEVTDVSTTATQYDDDFTRSHGLPESSQVAGTNHLKSFQTFRNEEEESIVLLADSLTHHDSENVEAQSADNEPLPPNGASSHKDITAFSANNSWTNGLELQTQALPSGLKNGSSKKQTGLLTHASSSGPVALEIAPDGFNDNSKHDKLRSESLTNAMFQDLHETIYVQLNVETVASNTTAPDDLAVSTNELEQTENPTDDTSRPGKILELASSDSAASLFVDEQTAELEGLNSTNWTSFQNAHSGLNVAQNVDATMRMAMILCGGKVADKANYEKIPMPLWKLERVIHSETQSEDQPTSGGQKFAHKWQPSYRNSIFKV